MSEKFNILFLLGLSLALGACATAGNTTSATAGQLRQETQKIKRNGLVFRLPDDQSRVAYLEKRGTPEQVAAEKTRIAENNRKIAGYFDQAFSFCPVRFFYASQQEELVAGKRVLLNSALVPDAAIPLPDTLLLAVFAPGALNDNTFKWTTFRIQGTGLDLQPTFRSYRGDRPLQLADVKKINRKLVKLNIPKKHGK
ncbi:MAG: hypothetical protein ABIP44_04420 [Pseudoxanthomonas sp.]